MLEKFLKFLKGNTREEEFEGSYLDHLLAQVRPMVRIELESCPEHDPLLLIIAEILRLTKPDQWTEPVECPLADDQSPSLAAPPPPAAEPADESDDGFEIVEAADVVEADDADDEETAGDEESDASEQDGGEDSSDLDQAADAAEADEAEEAEEETESVEELDEFAQRVSAATRLDSPEVLQAGRIFLGLLIENDRLPHDMQLSVAETMLARDLLLGYFVHDDQFEQKAKELLSLVEQKFNEGAFSQARILLQLFQTDRPTRINNDRNLFYEDMILRLGIRRRNLINHSLLAELESKSAADDLDAGLFGTTNWLEDNLHIKFHLFTREPEDVDSWRKFANQSRREEADEVFLRYIPPKRWRPLEASAQTPTERVVAHVSAATIKRYILRQIKACYFVLRAVGDTGLEPYLDVFFDWSETKFEFNSVRLMPLIYRRTMSDTQLIDKIFEEAFRRFYQKKAATFLEEFDDDSILEATRATLDGISGMDFNRIPPGNYDLGGLILDRLFGLEYHEPEFAFKLHRLT